MRRSPRARAGDDLDREDGVTPELEEVVVDAHPLEAEHLGPDLGQRLLGRARGGDVGALQLGPGALGGGKGGTVELAIRRQGKGVQRDVSGRQHELGQALAQEGAQLARPGAAPAGAT